MTRGIPILLAAFLLIPATAVLAAGSAGTPQLVFRPLQEPGLTVNGEQPPGARLFATHEWGLYVVELPSESKEVLVDVNARKAILLMRSEVQRGTNKKDEEVLRVDPRSALGVTSYVLDRNGEDVSFRTDLSDVQLRLPPRERKEGRPANDPGAEAAPAPGTSASAPGTPGTAPAPAPAPAASPETVTPQAASSDAARACVSLANRPTPGIPGCSKSIYLKNACDEPVVTTMRRTEHLMSGTLPELFNVTIPGGSEEWIGCSWWSGAMAPAQHDIVAAGFLERPGHGHHGHGPGTPPH